MSQYLAQWWYSLLAVLGWFRREPQLPTERTGYRLVLADRLENFDRWEWHEGWGNVRPSGTTYLPEQREPRREHYPARLRLDFGLQGYTAGMLFSKAAYLYGIYEARLKLPPAPVCAALWLYTPGGVPYQEVDVAEFAPANGANVVNFAYHKARGSDWTTPFLIKLDLGDEWRTRWHTYTLGWGPGYLTFMVDGAQLYTWRLGAPLSQMHVVLHLEVDPAHRPGQVPQYLEIDEIRIWERE